MINEIIESVAKTLSEAFPSCGEPYTENVEQGLAEPCFLITAISPQMVKERGRMYDFSVTLEIQYFPESKTEPKTEINDVIDKLDRVLELFPYTHDSTLEEALHWSMTRDYSILDNVLTCRLILDAKYMLDEEPAAVMEKLEKETEVN